MGDWLAHITVKPITKELLPDVRWLAKSHRYRLGNLCRRCRLRKLHRLHRWPAAIAVRRQPQCNLRLWPCRVVCRTAGPISALQERIRRPGPADSAEVEAAVPENVEYDNPEQREVPALAEIIRRGILEALYL